MEAGLAISAIIFLLTYLAIISGKVQRSVAAMVGAVAMVATGIYFGFYTEAEVIEEAIDWNTLGLLLGMMIIQGVLEDTGVFEALSVGVAKLSGGSYFRMLVLFGVLTAVASTTVDNLTTILVMAPVSFSICRRLEVDPRHLLVSEVIFSNIGGVATLVGDPPNVIISSASTTFSGVPAGGFTYLGFLQNLAPTVIICVLVTVVVYRIVYRSEIEEESSKINCKAMEDLMGEDPWEEIKNWALFKRSIPVFVFVILLFVVHHKIGLWPSSVAMIGAALTVLIAKPDMERLMEKVKWTSLLFFAGLFVVIYGVSETGVLPALASGVTRLSSGSLLIAAMAIIFITAFGSSIVDNIPFTIAMVPIVGEISTILGPESSILWWSLALGAGFGGNGAYIGSSAGVIAVKLSEDHGRPISFMYWLKHGTVIMMVTLAVASLMVALQIMTASDIPFLPG